MTAVIASLFTYPAWLWLTPLAGLLILAYLKRRSMKRQIVPSIFLLKYLPKHAAKKSRFKPPINFFLELLILILLCLAAASPIIKQDQEHLVLLIDNSFSMSAESNSTSRLKLALNDVANFTQTFSSDTTYDLYVTSPSLKKLNLSSLSRSELINLTQNISTVIANDKIESSISALIRDHNAQQLAIFTDKALTIPSNDKSMRIFSRSVFEPLANAYFISANISQTSITNERKIISANIGLSAAAPIEFNALLFTQDFSGKAQLLEEKNVTLHPRDNKQVDFALPARLNNIRGFELRLVPIAPGTDTITEDNYYFLTLEQSVSTNLLLVSDTDNFSDRLNNLVGTQTKRINSAQYLTLSPDDLRNYQAVIFHRTAPKLIGVHSAIFILPPLNNLIVPTRILNNKVSASSWDGQHPLLTYLRPSLLAQLDAVVFDTPAWAQSVVRSTLGDIIIAGSSRGVRLAAIGFEILPYEGADNPLTSVLLINALRWLSGEQGFIAHNHVGQKLLLEKNSSWVIVNAKGEIQNLTYTENQTNDYTLSDPGIYSITSITGSRADSLTRLTSHFAININLEDESKTWEQKTSSIPADIKSSSSSIDSQMQDYWRILVFIALIIALIDIILRVYLSKYPGLNKQQIKQEVA